MTNKFENYPGITHKLLSGSVRPFRIVTFFDGSDTDWRHLVLGIIEIYSTLWGGSGNIIIPIVNGLVANHFLELLEKYDADIYGYYAKSDLDIKMSRVGKEAYEKEIQMRMARFNIIRQDAERVYDLEHLNSRPDSDKEMINYLSTIITARFSPFLFSKRKAIIRIHKFSSLYRQALSLDPTLRYLAVQNIGLEDYELSKCSLQTELLLRSYVGSSSLMKRKKSALLISGIPSKATTHVHIINDISPEDVLRNVFYPSMRPHDAFKLGETGLGKYLPFEERQLLDKKEAVVVVIGSTPPDFALFYAMNRLQQSVYYLDVKDETVAEEDMVIAQLTLENIREDMNLREIAEVIVTSCSLSVRQIDACLDNNQIKGELKAGEGEINIQVLPAAELYFDRRYAVFEMNNYGKTILQQFHHNKATGYYEPPAPQHSEHIKIGDGRWINDLLIYSDDRDAKSSGYSLPNNFKLLKTVLSDVSDIFLTPKNLRKNGVGFSFISPMSSIAFTTDNIAALMIKPRIKLLNDGQVFKTLLDDHGIEMRLSDKGEFLNFSVDLFDNINNLAEALKNPGYQKCFDFYVGRISKQQIIQDNIKPVIVGKYIYLSHRELLSCFPDKEDMLKKRSEMLHRGLISRGFIFKCQQCKNADWYPMADISETFSCHRCGLSQIYTNHHWLQPMEEPVIYYRLNEMFYQGYKHNMRTTMLAIDQLDKQAKYSFSYYPETSLTFLDQSFEACEIDFIVLIDGQLFIGEAKSNGKFAAAEFEKYLFLEKRIGARCVFASNTKISDEKRLHIQKQPWAQIPLILTVDPVL